MRFAAALVGLAVVATPAAAEVAVRVSGGQVELTATAAPLAEILDRLARQTGMKVVYEGPAPRQLVTLSLHGRTPTETVLALFEGLGLNFALVADPTGARVQTLVVAGTAAVSPAASSAANAGRPGPAAMRRPFGPPPGSSPETAEPAFEADGDTEPDEPGVAPPAGAEATDPAGAPANPAANGNAQAPTGAGVIPTQPSTPFSSSPFTPQPQPFPPVPPGAPVAPAAPATPPEQSAPANPPPQ